MILRSAPLLACAAFLFCVPAHAGDAAAGKAKAAVACAVCHGADGLSQLPVAPNLAGQVEVYLVKALEEFRSGARQNDMMTLVAKDLTDDDIANLAAWYSSIEISVKTP